MKKLIILFTLICAGNLALNAQITTAQHKASFGVDAEVRAAFLGNLPQSITASHDWFSNTSSDRFMIDITGASDIVSKYAVDPDFRKLPFFRTMKYNAFSVLDNRMLIDAVYIRDYHGIDSTAFAISNKNGDSPGSWNGDVSNIPDKNDLLDVMVHVRRAGPQARLSDSLWFIGGIALDATSGNRYFDFELYQTDIFYNRATKKFTGYGPDFGHTSWQFDPVTGAVTKPGDVIFSANFGGSGLSELVARIWVNKTALSINSPNFDWTGDFDGASNSATYGYAGIKPKTGAIFYSGLQNAAATWAGPFQLVRADNSVQSNFSATQFLEFSVNMGTLGLDPISLLGGTGDPCGMPFRRILVKTRSSSSFTAELKDFIGPFDFFDFQSANAAADMPMICADNGVSTISLINPLPSSIYTWVTPNGHIVGDTTGFQITVDTPGTYIVRQQLLSGCNQYAADTVVITKDPNCTVLAANRINLKGRLAAKMANLEFDVSSNELVSYYVLERSTDKVHFSAIKTLNNNGLNGSSTYSTSDDLSFVKGTQVYYRVKLIRIDGSIRYSTVLKLNSFNEDINGFTITPNPVTSQTQLIIPSEKNQEGVIKIFNTVGALLEIRRVALANGNNIISLDGLEKWSTGIYPVQVFVGQKSYTQKMILSPRR